MMRPGLRRLTREQQLEIGVQVARARNVGVEWKVLRQVYDRDRTTLWRCMALAIGSGEFCNTFPEFCNTFTPSETA